MPKIEYSGYILTDISQRYSIVKSIKNNNNIFQDYEIQDYEKAEHLAHDFYGSSDFVWLIYLMNDIIDPFYGWILNNGELTSFITDKYGSGNEDNIHHYTLDEIEFSYNEPGSVPVTNTEYEDRINESKRKIKVIRPDFTSQILNELKNT